MGLRKERVSKLREVTKYDYLKDDRLSFVKSALSYYYLSVLTRFTSSSLEDQISLTAIISRML
jgi:hypothetical protein